MQCSLKQYIMLVKYAPYHFRIVLEENSRDMAIYFFGLSIRTFGVIAISVVNFFVACSVSEILKDK